MVLHDFNFKGKCGKVHDDDKNMTLEINNGSDTIIIKAPSHLFSDDRGSYERFDYLTVLEITIKGFNRDVSRESMGMTWEGYSDSLEDELVLRDNYIEQLNSNKDMRFKINKIEPTPGGEAGDCVSLQLESYSSFKMTCVDENYARSMGVRIAKSINKEAVFVENKPKKEKN